MFSDNRIDLLDASSGLEGSGLRVKGELPWFSFTFCSACGNQSPPLCRFARPGATLGECSCGQPLVAAPLGMRSVIPAADLLACLDKPLSELGIGPGAAVGMSLDDDWTYFLLQPNKPQVGEPGGGRSS